MFDYVIIGSGLAGSVVAERLSRKNKSILVIEQRPHIGGNCYDECMNNILVHKYGPHLFHTDNQRVWEYLSQFTDWHYYNHYALAFVDGKYVPLPFNLNTLYDVFPYSTASKMESKLLDTFTYNRKVPIVELLDMEDNDLKFLAMYIHEKIFAHYTEKQWGMPMSKLDQSVISRVPIFIGRDDRYFTNKYQGVPKAGYTKMIQNILNQPNIKLLLNTNFHEVMSLDGKSFRLFDQPYNGTVIYTGMLDELFNYKYGKLEYRSLDLRFEESTESLPAPVVNYPSNYTFTRRTDFKQIHPADSLSTVILTEYPQPYVTGKNLPYYPILNDNNKSLYQKYFDECSSVGNLHIIGRLSEYIYYNMDEVIDQSIRLSRKL